jgi:hypothetical protein
MSSEERVILECDLTADLVRLSCGLPSTVVSRNLALHNMQ